MTGTRAVAAPFLLRSIFLALGLALLLSSFGWRSAHAEIILTDAAGREIRLEKPATRIATNESLLLLSLALIDPDPAAKIVGWAAPRRLDSGVHAAFRKRFPQAMDIPEVGGVLPSKSSAEAILSARPDLFVVSIWDPGWSDIVEILKSAGVPTIFLDSPKNSTLSPAEVTAFSMTLLGKAIGQDTKAGEYAGFVKERYRLIEERLKGAKDRPSVLVDAHAGAVCCSSPGASNRMTEAIEMAGGHSIGADIPGYDGQLSAEFVLGIDPKVYIATGGPHLAAQGGLVVGGGVSAQSARASLQTAIGRDFRGELTAIRSSRAYAVSHQLSISALSFLVFECFAKWLHPELFGDLDPDRTLAEINERFMAVPLEGTFWIGLKDHAAPTPQ
ncbi:Fe3+-hydroxamate ABC transporter substrate-binding protein [Mesorhizobium loti]|nr:ABC transporter substrate-binding protein [Mesorhizobium loti]PLP61408.1 Fe3+-hydroxamate ABC transporter substrate-binding protein [Mesorhizobium loti]